MFIHVERFTFRGGAHNTKRRASGSMSPMTARSPFAMCTIRPSIEVVRVYSRSAENRLGFVARMQPQMHARVDGRSACSGRERCRPHLPRHRQQRAGTIRRMARAGSTRHLDRCQQQGRFPQGSVSRPRREFDDALIARAGRVVATLKEQAVMDEQADLFEPVQNGVTSWD
jgi:hypothetical protein